MLWDNAPHRCNTYTASSTTDAGAGTVITYTLAQSDVPCLINTSGANERELFAQMGVVVTHRVSFKTSVLAVPLARGMKIVSGGDVFHVKAINGGLAFLGVPPLVYAECEQQL